MIPCNAHLIIYLLGVVGGVERKHFTTNNTQKPCHKVSIKKRGKVFYKSQKSTAETDCRNKGRQYKI
jgi:hypothetical protein